MINMWYIDETIISKSNLKIKLKISFLWKSFFWQKDYSPLKQSKQIGSLISECTQLTWFSKKNYKKEWVLNNPVLI